MRRTRQSVKEELKKLRDIPEYISGESDEDEDEHLEPIRKGRTKRTVSADSDVSEELEEEFDDETDGEIEDWSDLSDIDSDECEIDAEFEVSADKNVWKKHVFTDEELVTKGRIPSESILRVKPGPTTYATQNVSDITSALNLFIDDSILEHICKCTEAEAKRKLQIDDWSLTKNELRAFIGVCYARGALGMKNMSITNLFSVKYGPPLIRGIMQRERFKTIMRFLRFDDKDTRKQRLLSDKFALFSTVWEKFIQNCKKCYSPDSCVTIDEQLFPSKTRCPFTQFIKEKPDKFGQKYFFAVDVDSKYILNGFPYLGADDTRGDKNVGESIALRLMEPYFGGGYNVTTDSFFTSLDLAISLKEQKITLVGTVNKNRRWLPETARLKKPNISLHETIIFLGPNATTLTLYQSKKKKSVSVLSSLHKTVKISDSDKKKPETIQFYNHTKYGVDIADQMAKRYSVKAGSRRWPVHSFYNVLDLAGINAHIIYKKVTGKTIPRIKFLLQLAEDLAKPHKAVEDTMSDIPPPGVNLRKRQNTQDSNGRNKSGAKKKLPENPIPKRKHCQMQNCKNKSAKICYECKKLICGKCTALEKLWCKKCFK